MSTTFARALTLMEESRIATYNLFAYKKDDEHYEGDLSRRGLPHYRIGEALSWAFERGCDTVLIERSDVAPSLSRLVTHHACTDPCCPGGCT